MIKTEGYSDNLFLIVTMFHSPANNVHTEKKGWMDTSSNFATREHPQILTRVSTKNLCEASVIVDLKKDVLVKNRFVENNADDIKNHFKAKYASAYQNA